MKKITLGLLCLTLGNYAWVADADPALPLVVKSIQLSTPATRVSAADSNALAVLENKYYRRNFEADTAEKRLSRLELFLTGSSKKGSLSGRIANLKEISESNSRLANTSGVRPTKHNLSQSVTQLELAIQKSTSPNLKLDLRLGNLEKKVFGRVFSGISVQQRIARLQKTIALTDSDLALARPLRERSELAAPGMPFTSPFALPYGIQNGEPLSPELNGSMAEMFNQLNRDLRQFHKLPPDVYESTPFNFPGFGGNPYPGGPSRDFGEGVPDLPKGYGREAKPILPSYPPYMDSNSI
jgi:hypothetical protein